MTDANPAVQAETGEPLDLAEIRPWLMQCRSCDFGLTGPCSHPDGDYRIPMAKLFAEVEFLREAFERKNAFLAIVVAQRGDLAESLKGLLDAFDRGTGPHRLDAIRHARAVLAKLPPSATGGAA